MGSASTSGGAEGPRGAEGADDAGGARRPRAAAERVAALVPAVTEEPRRSAARRHASRGRGASRRAVRPRGGERGPPRDRRGAWRAGRASASRRVPSSWSRPRRLRAPACAPAASASSPWRGRSFRPRWPRRSAWLIATEVVGHSQPFFAPISAVVTLGLTVGERRRRAVELAIGVAVESPSRTCSWPRSGRAPGRSA